MVPDSAGVIPSPNLTPSSAFKPSATGFRIGVPMESAWSVAGVRRSGAWGRRAGVEVYWI